MTLTNTIPIPIPIPSEPSVPRLFPQRLKRYLASTASRDLGAPLGACLSTYADGMDGLVTAVPLPRFATPITETLIPTQTLPSLPLTVWWGVFDQLLYSECWKMTFVDKVMRAHLLTYLEMVLRRKLRSGRWIFVLETQLCRDISTDPETYFTGIFPHFDRRTLDLCLDLRATRSAHANVELPGSRPHCNRTCLGLYDTIKCADDELHSGRYYHHPGTTHPLDRTPHCVSFCLTLRRSLEAVGCGRRAVFVEWGIGRGDAETTFGFESDDEDGRGKVSMGRMAKMSMKDEVGREKTIAHVVYQEAHWNYTGRDPRRGGVEFIEVKFVPLVLFQALEKMRA